jgi:hypothetical protein
VIFPNPLRFFAAIARSTWAKLRGYDVFVSEPVERERWQICRRCPWMIPAAFNSIAGADQCRICGCFLDAKLTLAMEQCPKKKWLAVWTKKRTIT